MYFYSLHINYRLLVILFFLNFPVISYSLLLDSSVIYKPNVELGFKVGNSRSMLRPSILIPLWQNDSNLIFTDVMGIADTRKQFEGNFGLGYRYLVDSFIVGAYGFYDTRRTSRGNVLHQLTAGLEVLCKDFEVRGNLYYPISNKKIIDSRVINLSLNFTGVNTELITNAKNTFEKPLMGFDVEAGGNLPTFHRIQSYIGYYLYRDSAKVRIQGVRGRLQYKLSNIFSFEGEISYDKARSYTYFIGGRLTYQFETKSSTFVRELRDKMTQTLVRDIDIVHLDQTAVETKKTKLPRKWLLLDTSNLVNVQGNVTFKNSVTLSNQINSNIAGYILLDKNHRLKISKNIDDEYLVMSEQEKAALSQTLLSLRPEMSEQIETVLTPSALARKTKSIINGVKQNGAVVVTYINLNDGLTYYLVGRNRSHMTGLASGRYTFPGGGIDKIDRSFLEGAFRELKEETQLDGQWYVQNQQAEIKHVETISFNDATTGRASKTHIYQLNLGALNTAQIVTLHSKTIASDDLAVAVYINRNQINQATAQVSGIGIYRSNMNIIFKL